MLVHYFPAIMIILVVAAFIAGMAKGVVEHVQGTRQAKQEEKERQATFEE